MEQLTNNTVVFLEQLTSVRTERKEVSLQEQHKAIIEKIIVTYKIPVQVFYIPFSSELNTMGGKWNIFLDERKPEKEILNDFNVLLKTYFENKKALPL